jgi:predicted acyltransferase
MTSPVQQAPSLLAALRLRRFRAASLVLLAAVLLAQTALVVHRIDHARPEHGAVCALCVAADHQAAPSHHAAVATSPLLPDFVPASIRPLAAAPALLSYRSRAPPEHRRA